MNKDISKNLVRLHSQIFGDSANPKLLILHGLFGSSANWRSVARRLSSSHKVFCLDLRNHGQSPWHDDMSYPAMARDVVQFMLDNHLQGSAVIGHSMGGKTAMMLAQEQNIELAKLLVVDIAPVTYRYTHLDMIDAMQAIDFTTVTSRKQIDDLLSVRIPDPATRQFLTQNLKKDGDYYSWRINLDAIRQNMYSLISYENDLTSPVDALFVAGSNSNYIGHEYHSEVFKRFPGARIETIENSGHWLHAEQPARFIALCNSFLAD